MTTKNDFASQLIEKRFFSDFRELFSHFDADKVFQSLSSYLQLNHSAEELTSAATSPRDYRKMLALAAITLIDRGAVVPISDLLNEAALEDLAKLRRETGIGAEPLPPPPPTADELLREEVTNDWRTLSMDKLRQKRNANRKYGVMLDRLANEGGLDSQVTSIQRLG